MEPTSICGVQLLNNSEFIIVLMILISIKITATTEGYRGLK